MKKIIFMRHSFALGALDAGVKNDELRPLSPKGVETAQHTVKLLEQRVSKVDRIITSPKVRALQTAQIIGEGFEVKPEAYAELNQELSLPDLWNFIKHQVDEGATLLAIGHNPDFSQLVSTLAQTYLSLNPAEFAIITFDDDFENARLEPINPEAEQ